MEFLRKKIHESEEKLEKIKSNPHEEILHQKMKQLAECESEENILLQKIEGLKKQISLITTSTSYSDKKKGLLIDKENFE